MAVLEAIESETAALVYNIIGPRTSPTPLRLPYAKLATTMLASPPWYGISFDHAVGPVLQEPFLHLPGHADRTEVVRQLTAANLLMTRPCSRYGEEAR
jgi:hypothetical protein